MADSTRRFVYDATGALVAVLFYDANRQLWECDAGPTDFDPTEAIGLPTGNGLMLHPYSDSCAAMSGDAGTDATDGVS